jgi:hypothetical protein
MTETNLVSMRALHDHLQRRWLEATTQGDFAPDEGLYVTYIYMQLLKAAIERVEEP